MLLWNLVDLLDAEGGWLIELLIILTSMTIFTHFLKKILDNLHNKYREQNEIWKDAFVGAAFRPISFYIWCFVLAHAVDIVSDRLISQQFLDEARMIFYISGTLSLTWYFFRVKQNLVDIALEKQSQGILKMDSGQIVGFGKLATLVIITISILLLMEVSGVNIKTVIAFGGVSGLAIAIASQEVIANIFGGVMIYTANPFSVRDVIHLPDSDIEGTVETIGWYQTSLRSLDKRPIYIPNSLFSKALVINVSRMSHRKIKETISVRHQDLPAVPLIIRDIKSYLESNRDIDQTEEILVHIARVEAYSVSLSIQAHSVITNEQMFLKIRDDIFINTANVIKKHNAQIAIPIQARA